MIIGMVCIGVFSSCRDIQPPFSSVQSITGYQLSGRVTTANGIPLDSVQVILYYNYDYVGSSPMDTQQVIVDSLSQIIDVSVYTPNIRYVRRLYHGIMQPGPVPRFRWNGRDDDGIPVPSGKYLIRYTIDSVTVKDSPVLVQGHVTTISDPLGRFVLGNERLPIGEKFDFYGSDGSFSGVARLIPYIDIELFKQGLHGSFSNISLTQGSITSGSFTL